MMADPDLYGSEFPRGGKKSFRMSNKTKGKQKQMRRPMPIFFSLYLYRFSKSKWRGILPESRDGSCGAPADRWHQAPEIREP